MGRLPMMADQIKVLLEIGKKREAYKMLFRFVLMVIRG
jgi:hypothetical protein